MATVTHIAAGLALSRIHDEGLRGEPRGGDPSPSRVLASMATFTFLSALPDLDLAADVLGIHPLRPYGHRGFTHSLAFALAAGTAFAVLSRGWGGSFLRRAFFGSLATASHGLLDALAGGYLGVALLWPFSDDRYSAPLQLLPNAPPGMALFTTHGAMVVVTETVMMLPIFSYGLRPLCIRSMSLRTGAIGQ